MWFWVGLPDPNVQIKGSQASREADNDTEAHWARPVSQAAQVLLVNEITGIWVTL